MPHRPIAVNRPIDEGGPKRRHSFQEASYMAKSVIAVTAAGVFWIVSKGAAPNPGACLAARP